jgi:pimeloyl-ACP methyl ester carboxylesterase
MSTERHVVRRAVVAITATAALIAPSATTAALTGPAAAADPRAAVRYCPRYDAYELGSCRPRHRLPDSAVGRQLRWVLEQLGGASSTLTVAEVRKHLTPGLRQTFPARQARQVLERTLAERGSMQLVGFSYPPRPGQAAALVQSRAGTRGAVAIGVVGHRIDFLELDDGPPTVVPRGPHSGLFDVGRGREMFLRCTGTGSPTVVLENGLVSDWYEVQNRLSRTTRVCSYDPARMAGPWGRSDPAPAPRDGHDRVADLHRLLAAAHVPPPYVLAGHSNGGLFSLLYASQRPRQVAGMVLIDGVHPAYHRRSIAVAKRFVPPDHWHQILVAACGLQPIQLDAEQMDICLAEAQTRHALARSPLRPMPLAVISRGHARFSPGTPEAAQERLWRRLQHELAGIAPGSRHVVAAGSSHDIQHERPDLVVREITDVVAAVRDGRTRLDPEGRPRAS